VGVLLTTFGFEAFLRLFAYADRGTQIPKLVFCPRPSVLHNIMTKCLGPRHDFDDFTTYELTTFTTSRLAIDLETGFTVQK
jgi:hypothetical protein